MQSDVADPQILSRRLGAFLKAQGPTKDVARRIAADERTVENIRAGRTWPIARHWLRIWFEFGDDVLEAVFYPERVEARLAREAEAREQARQQRIASASRVAVEKAFRLARRAGEHAVEDTEELGPPNLDLFEVNP
jgi:flagellar biosynthesis/type III secretory pathway protein FliH